MYDFLFDNNSNVCSFGYSLIYISSQYMLVLNLDHQNRPWSDLNMQIERKYKTFYLIAILVFGLLCDRLRDIFR